MRNFGRQFWKAIVIFEISTLECVNRKDFMQKKTFLNLGLNIPYLGIFRLTFNKIVIMFEISTLEFVKIQSSCKNKNPETLDQNCVMWVFSGGNFINYYHISN